MCINTYIHEYIHVKHTNTYMNIFSYSQSIYDVHRINIYRYMYTCTYIYIYIHIFVYIINSIYDVHRIYIHIIIIHIIIIHAYTAMQWYTDIELILPNNCKHVDIHICRYTCTLKLRTCIYSDAVVHVCRAPQFFKPCQWRVSYGQGTPVCCSVL